MGDSSSSGRIQWKHAVAGSTAGLATQLILHPLDVIKTRLQVQDGAGMLPAYKGTMDAVRQIVRQEGWRALYSGLTPAVVGSGMAWGIYFWSYNRAKQRYQRSSGTAKLSPGMHLLSAAEAGALVCFITNPVWVVKTRLQLQRRTLQQAAAAATAATAGATPAAAPAAAAAALSGTGTAAQSAGTKAAAAAAAAAASGWGAVGEPAARGASALSSFPRRLFSGVPRPPGACAVEYSGFLHAFVQVARCEGLRGLYKGLLPSLLLVSHGAIQFAVYEELKSAAQGFRGFTASVDSASASRGSSSRAGAGTSASTAGHRGAAAVGQVEKPARQLSPAEITACGALSKLAASVTTYPSQVVRSRLQQRMDARTLQYSGVTDVVRKTLQREGIGGFYKGLAPNVLRVMPQSALTFLVYESVMRLLNQQPVLGGG